MQIMSFEIGWVSENGLRSCALLDGMNDSQSSCVNAAGDMIMQISGLPA